MVEHRGVVPYIAQWSGEDVTGHVVTRVGRIAGRIAPIGIGYVDAIRQDRDSIGVLWSRMASTPGLGRPLFGKIHTFRQRRAMRRLLCQVCGGPADVNERGALWLLRDYRDDWPGWPENMANGDPPLCLPCARLAVRLCPALRGGHVAVRARSTVAAVRGVLYRPAYPLAESGERVTVPLDSSRLPWTLATSLVRTLHDCTFVTLDELEDHARR